MKKLTGIVIGILIVISTYLSVSAMEVTYTSMGVPTNISTYFKSYMDYRTITNRASNQYKFVNSWGWSDYDGFMRCNGETDLGITDNYYLVALGSYYGTEIGTKYKITTDTGNVFYAALGECKDNRDTNSTHQYATRDNSVVEFIVDTKKLDPYIIQIGSANVYMPLNGNITKIEKISFN